MTDPSRSKSANGDEIPVSLRQATEADHECLWLLHVATMRAYVEATWGWDEAQQRRNFDAKFDPTSIRIIEQDTTAIGYLQVEWNLDLVFIANIRVAPPFQNRGIGTRLVRQVLQEAEERGLPVELRVLRVNPARRWYERLGFVVTHSDDVRYYMRWTPQSASERSPVFPIADFGQTSRVAVTILIDNRADLLVRSAPYVKRFTKQPLLAEHGFAALIQLRDAGITILWDSGMTEGTFVENVGRMKVDLSRVDAIALSHGHGDHTAGITAALKAMNPVPKERRWPPEASWEDIERYSAGRIVPLVAHPAAFRERWGVGEDGVRQGPDRPPPRAEWEAAGARIVLSASPYRLGPGCWTTGEVPRRSFEQAGRPKRPVRPAYREGRELLPDDLEEDQAIVIHVAGKGLVVVSGRAHSGIVNTVNHARQISGVDKVFAILGGFHLARASDEERRQTIAAIQSLRPRLIAPSHCTGFPAMAEFAAQMPRAFVEGVVGTTYTF